MDYDSFEKYQADLKWLKTKTRLLLAAVAVILLLLLFFGVSGMSREEKVLYDRVRGAQNVLWEQRHANGTANLAADRNKTGLIGFEWGEFATTLGDLAAKRTSCDPRWSVVVSRWLKEAGVKQGDTVLVLSSSSFPGFILNTLFALDYSGIKYEMVLSLGASTWGADDYRISWFKLTEILAENGIALHRGDYYTLGGGGEIGGAIEAEGIDDMKRIAAQANVPLVVKNSYEEMLAWKQELVESKRPKAIISIGGSHTNMGNDPAILDTPPGLITDKNANCGDGIIGRSVSQGIPTIHLLNVRALCEMTGIPFDAVPRKLLRSRISIATSAIGLVVFALLLLFFKRWKLEK